MKKVLVLALCLLMIAASTLPVFAYSGENYFPFSTAKTTIPTNEHIAGDSNGDGIVNLLDSMAVFKYIAGNKENTLRDSIDTNSDGVVSVVDALLIIKHLLGSGVGLGELVG